MKNILLVLFLFFSINELSAQFFELELLDDTVLTGDPNPMDPIIFHFEAVNQTDSTYLVDMIKFEQDIPGDWEISLCTEACFPPEVDEAVFFLDEMATDDISVYFYPGSVGSGKTKVEFINREDSLNSFTYTLYANAIITSVIEQTENLPFLVMDTNNDLIYLNGNLGNTNNFPVYNAHGQLVKTIQYSRNEAIDISTFQSGIYFIEVSNSLLKFIRF